MLTSENIEMIRNEFAEMRTKEHLLDLLNFIAYPQLRKPGFLPDDIDLSKVDIPETADVSGKLTAIFNSSPKIRRKQITAKQLSYFATSFTSQEKKRKRYHQFFILKKSGKYREIHAPVFKLKQIQECIYQMLQSIYEAQPQAYGFVPGKSIVDNAALHTCKAFVLNVDLKDFFPSVYFRRVKAMLEKPPFNLGKDKEPLAYLIANLCTENGVLPQGAPTSPFFTNVICQRMDRKLDQLGKQFRATYSRYADDITFSASEYVFTKRFMHKLEQIIQSERFRINEEKTRIQGKAYRQEVTGLTVNEKVNVNRQYFRSYRTLLHLYKSKGPLVAFDYHYRRMPESVAAIRKRSRIFNKTAHIQNVIWGKYLFLKMIKGDAIPEPPFTRNRYARVVVTDITSFLHPAINIQQPNEELKEGRAVDTAKPRIETILIKPSEERVSSQENKPEESPVEQLLNTWEKEGLGRAIELLNRKNNEQ